ncbi:type II secretion system protein GspL [Colwelliaceae bacterium 6471]
MSETLFIRLGSQKQDLIHWLIWSSNQQEIIASGELTNAEHLSELTEKSQQREVVTFVPGCDVAIKQLTVPGKSQRAIRLAAPYMLEDELAQDVEQLFFAYSNLKQDAQGHNCFVAAVGRTQIEKWRDWLTKAEIRCKIMIPDVLAMPYHEDTWSVVALGHQLLIRQSQWQGMVVDQATWQMIVDRWQQRSKSDSGNEEGADSTRLPVLNAYSPLPVDIEGLQINAMPEELPLALLAQHVKAQSFNLLQGEFQVKEERSPVLVNWYWAAGIAAFALLANVGMKGAELLKLNAQQQVIEEQIITTYKKAFPESRKVRVATIKSQLKRKLSEVGSTNTGEGFLTMLNKTQPAFSSVPSLKPESLRFDGKRQEIRIQAVAKDYQSFDKFKVALEKAKLSVNQGAQNNQGEQVTGSFSITDKGNK